MRPSTKLTAAFLLAAVAACAQSTLETLNPLGAQGNGLRLSSISLFGGYASVNMPAGSSLAGAIPGGPDNVAGGELLLRWDRSGPRGGFSLSYTPSYTALLRLTVLSGVFWLTFMFVLTACDYFTRQ